MLLLGEEWVGTAVLENHLAVSRKVNSAPLPRAQQFCSGYTNHRETVKYTPRKHVRRCSLQRYLEWRKRSKKEHLCRMGQVSYFVSSFWHLLANSLAQEAAFGRMQLLPPDILAPLWLLR